MSDYIQGNRFQARSNDFGDQIALDDSKIKFILNYTKGRRVLDLGCVQHNQSNYYSRYWLHKAILSNAAHVVGLDLSKSGVEFLTSKGLDVHYADAQNFDLDQKFDVIVAGDIIEHLHDLSGFFGCCTKHLENDGRLIISTPNPWHWKFSVLSALHGGSIQVNAEHTCWFCPTTLSQLLERYAFELVRYEFGSRYMKDRLIPLPKGLKHTTFYAEIRLKR